MLNLVEVFSSLSHRGHPLFMAFLPHGASRPWGWQHQNGDKCISGNTEVKVQNLLR